MLMIENEYPGSCFCGSVQLRVVGNPAAMGFCHCASCRHWSASPVNAFTLWSPKDLTVTRGADQIATYKKTDKSIRKWCRACGGHLFTEHPQWGLVDVYAAIIPSFPFKPLLHVNYQERVLRLHDGLVKQLDLPAEMGGSSTLLSD